ncbi:hypothetical protein L218DRAFT_165489 [Marasmius fiardii PR-910]|nr:hypothetical protein L218DRAFT_165489 [Marasmius fiardii PR-910]
MFSQRKKRHSQSLCHKAPPPSQAVRDETPDPAFSPIPASLISSAYDEDLMFSPLSYDSPQVAAASRRKLPSLAPSSSSSSFFSPLRKAMKMSGILEQPSSEFETESEHVPAYSVLDFTRQDVRPFTSSSRPKEPSGLTQLLSSPAPPITNPFSGAVGLTLLKAKKGGSNSNGLRVTVYFPHVVSPAGEAMELNIHEEANIEELIGMALWTYWENGWIPQLDINHTEDTRQRSLKSVASGWTVYPVKYGFVDSENGACAAPDKVRLLDGILEFAVLKASEDSYRRTQSLGHRKSYSMPSSRMSLLQMPSRKKDHGSYHDPLTRSVLVKNDLSDSSVVVEAPVYSTMHEITRKACKEFNLSHAEDMTLVAIDVQKTLRQIPPESLLLTFSDDVEFTLFKKIWY